MVGATSGLFLMALAIIIPSCTKEPLEQHKNFDRNQMLENIGQNVILHNHQVFVEKAQELENATNTFTTSPDLGTLVQAQEKWKATMDAWKMCELFDLGIVKDTYLHNKIEVPANPSFIPNNIYSTTTIDNAYIDGVGSSSKGLSALEFLLFDRDNGNQAVLDSFLVSSHDTRFRQYTAALAENLRHKGEELYAIWSPTGQDYVTEFAESEGSDLGSSISMLANEMITLIEKMVQTKLGKPLGKQSDGLPHPEFVESYESGHSLENLRLNLHSLEITFEGLTANEVDSIGLDDYLNALKARHDDEALPEVVEAQFIACHTALDAINEPLADAVVNDYETVNAAYNELRKLLILLKVDVANNLAITVTFNDNDGD